MRGSFLAFLGSLFLSKLADQILLFLVPLVIYQTTKNVAWSGLAFFAEAFPRFLSFPICGALCDTVSPLKLLKASQICRALFCLAGIVSSHAFGGVGWLVALSAICGVLTTQGFMAREVMLPHLFKGYQFHKVLAYSQTADQTGFVLGPVAAAVLLDRVRWEGAVAAAAVLFLLADTAMTLWHRLGAVTLPATEARHATWLTPVKTALHHVMNVPGLLKLVLLACGVNLVIGVTLASSAALVVGLYGKSNGYYATLQTAAAIVTVLVLLTIARVTIPLKTMAVFSYVCIFAGGVITAISPNHWFYALGFLMIMGFDKMFNIYIRATRQKIIPAHDYGKTTGVIVMLNNLTQPLAGLLIGLCAGPAQTGWMILALSVVMGCMGAIIVAASSPVVANI